jgi:hypothetical protein
VTRSGVPVQGRTEVDALPGERIMTVMLEVRGALPQHAELLGHDTEAILAALPHEEVEIVRRKVRARLASRPDIRALMKD